jgi:hypothetical protein
LNGVFGLTGSAVYAVGTNGTILRQSGWGSWAAEPSSTANALYGVWGSSGTDFFAVGAGGTILHYDGSAWSGMTSNTSANLNAVWGASSTDVFAVGGNGTILHYAPDLSTTTTTADLTTTTTIDEPIPTTTTTVFKGPCPAQKVLGENNPKLDNLRALRDGTLARSAVGRSLILLYYNHAGSINAALDRSPALRAAARRALDAVASMAGIAGWFFIAYNFKLYSLE